MTRSPVSRLFEGDGECFVVLQDIVGEFVVTAIVPVGLTGGYRQRFPLDRLIMVVIVQSAEPVV